MPNLKSLIVNPIQDKVLINNKITNYIGGRRKIDKLFTETLNA